MEKKTKLKKVKDWFDKNKTEIVCGTVLGTSVVISYMVGKKVNYRKGYRDGNGFGFERTIKWFDQTLGTNLETAYSDYVKKNPDKIVYYVKPGV